jgi:2-keto-4-pentenoate hydratase/2-oxohepta-3-ene-1,7-dioic acid hydratase in catechol pathway
MRVGPAGSEIPVVEVDGATYDLRPVTADIDGAFLGRLDELPQLPLIDIDGLRIGAPIARPAAVVCIGQNYAGHAAESGSPVPTVPIIFFKHPNTVVGAFDDVIIPPRATTVDWEVELGVVIGKRASYIDSIEDALDYVAGYVVSHDVSERTWQKEESGGQWSKGKTAETFNPVGPFLVPAAELDPQALRIWSTVNGEKRQDSNTSDMVFSVAYLVWNLSQYMVLEPGDLINTGTPQGVAMSGNFPFLQPGDAVELGIDGLGTQRQKLFSRE